MDPVARAFPDAALQDQACEVLGEALIALVDAGVELDAARALVREAVKVIVEDFES